MGMKRANKYFSKRIQKASGTNRGNWEKFPDEFTNYSSYLAQHKQDVLMNALEEANRLRTTDAEVNLGYKPTEEPTYALWKLNNHMNSRKQTATFYQQLAQNVRPEKIKQISQEMSIGYSPPNPPSQKRQWSEI